LVPVVIAQFAPISAACRIEVSEPDRRRIAVVGAGGIVDVAHLPAYRGLGLDVVGIMDLNGDRARTVATRHGIPRVYADLDELLDDGDVEVVDVAVDPHAQPEIIGRVISAGRHVLGQKPFAPSSAVALQLATQADANGVHLAVNQQLRFDEGVAAAHRMVELGWIGEVTAISLGGTEPFDSLPRCRSVVPRGTDRGLLGRRPEAWTAGGRRDAYHHDDVVHLGSKFGGVFEPHE
jgi:hypothetical protein